MGRTRAERERESLSERELYALCNTAQRAWENEHRNVKRVRFAWQGRAYVAKHSLFGVIVETPSGGRIAAMYVD